MQVWGRGALEQDEIGKGSSPGGVSKAPAPRGLRRHLVNIMRCQKPWRPSRDPYDATMEHGALMGVSSSGWLLYSARDRPGPVWAVETSSAGNRLHRWPLVVEAT